jgi:hypothetical protein
MLPGIKVAAAQASGKIPLKQVNKILAGYNALEGGKTASESGTKPETPAARVARAVRVANRAAGELGDGSSTEWGKLSSFFENFTAKNPGCVTEIEQDSCGRVIWLFIMATVASILLLANCALRICGLDATSIKGDSPDDAFLLLLQCRLSDGRIWTLAAGYCPTNPQLS